MRIELVYALAQEQHLVVLDLPVGSTVKDAVLESGLLQRMPEIELGRVGVWGQPARPDTRLRDRDRVELYRPLIADPKELRRKRAVGNRRQANRRKA